MKRCIVLLGLLACSSSSTPDGGSDASATCEAGCSTSVSDYCQVATCFATAASDIAGLCVAQESGIKVYSGCGYTLVFSHNATSYEEDIYAADGTLTAILGSPNGSATTCCYAGPVGFDVPGIQGCLLALPSCDAGASDAGAD